MSDDEINLNLVGVRAMEKANTYLNPRSAQIGEYNTFIQNHLQEEEGDSPDLKKCKEFLKENILLMRHATGSAKNQLIKIINSRLQTGELGLNTKATVPQVAEECCKKTDTQQFANCRNGRPICYCCNLPVITTAELENIETKLTTVANASRPKTVSPNDWKPIVDKLKEKVKKELPSKPETEHLQSIAQSTFTRMLPQSDRDLAQPEIFAFAHSCCNAIKTDMEFISFDYRNTRKWVINHKAINKFYSDLYGLTKADSKNWYWSCYKKYAFPPYSSDRYDPQKARKQLEDKLNELLAELNQEDGGGGGGDGSIKALRQQKERALFKRMYYQIIQNCKPPATASSSFSKKSSMNGGSSSRPSTPVSGGGGGESRREPPPTRVDQRLADKKAQRGPAPPMPTIDTSSKSGEQVGPEESKEPEAEVEIEGEVVSPSPTVVVSLSQSDSESESNKDVAVGNINFLTETQEINRNFIAFILELDAKNIKVNEEVYDSLYFLLTNPIVTQYIMSDGKEPVPTMSKETMMEFPYEKISHPPKPTIDSRVADGGGRGTRRSRGESLAGRRRRRGSPTAEKEQGREFGRRRRWRWWRRGDGRCDGRGHQPALGDARARDGSTLFQSHQQ